MFHERLQDDRELQMHHSLLSRNEIRVTDRRSGRKGFNPMMRRETFDRSGGGQVTQVFGLRGGRGGKVYHTQSCDPQSESWISGLRAVSSPCDPTSCTHREQALRHGPLVSSVTCDRVVTCPCMSHWSTRRLHVHLIRRSIGLAVGPTSTGPIHRRTGSRLIRTIGH